MHNFSKVDWVSMETLRLLKHKLVITSVMRTDYEQDFRKEYAIGDTVRVKYPWRPIIRTGLAYTPQPIDRIETTVKAEQVYGSDFDIGTIDKLLNMERGEEKVRKEYLDPIATYLAAKIDVLAAEFAYQNANNITGVLGTNPTTFDATSAAARQRLVELDCPESGQKKLFVPPAVMRSIKSADVNRTLFHPAPEIERLYKKGVVGQADDFRWYESNSLKLHTAGTIAGAVTLNGAVANGATSLAVTCTAGDTFKKGDVYGIAGVFAVNPVTRERAQATTTYTVSIAEDVVAAGVNAVLPINETINFAGNYQNVDAQPANGAALTLFPGTAAPSGKQGKQGLALHEDAYAFVCLPLPMPNKEEIVTSQRDPETGLWIGYIRSFDVKERKWINRFDTGLIGFGRLHVEACSVRVLCG